MSFSRSTSTTTSRLNIFTPGPRFCPRPTKPSHCEGFRGQWSTTFCTWICLPDTGPIECPFIPDEPSSKCERGWRFIKESCSWYCPITIVIDPNPETGGISCSEPEPLASECTPAGLWTCDFPRYVWKCLPCALAVGDCLP